MTGFRFARSIDAFHERASATRGLMDFGTDEYRTALAHLCDSLDEDAKLTPIGEFALQAMITDALEARLLCEEGHRRAPTAHESEIRRPLFIIGLPRTGTTALHHLIAQDPGLQALEHWLERTPKPRPARSIWPQDPDYQAAAARLEAIYERSPEMRAIHEIEAELPDECWVLFAQSFLHSSFQANADVESYASWWTQQDLTGVYRRHLRNAQLIGHLEPQRRWLFKDATHLFDLDALLRVYPDAMIVQTHRDPLSVIPSVCSLCWSARDALNEGTDQRAFGRSTMALWADAIDAMMDARARHDPEQFFDLPFEAFTADPIAAIQSIYRHFDLEYSDEADDAIRRFREARPKGRHGDHAYSLDEWGLDADGVRERFSRYAETHLSAPASTSLT